MNNAVRGVSGQPTGYVFCGRTPKIGYQVIAHNTATKSTMYRSFDGVFYSDGQISLVGDIQLSDVRSTRSRGSGLGLIVH
jgi:hypothetical protein